MVGAHLEPAFRRFHSWELKCRDGKVWSRARKWTLNLGVWVSVRETADSRSGIDLCLLFVLAVGKSWGSYCSPRLERSLQMNLVEKCLPPASPNIPDQLSNILPTLVCDVFESRLFGFFCWENGKFQKKGMFLKHIRKYSCCSDIKLWNHLAGVVYFSRDVFISADSG